MEIEEIRAKRKTVETNIAKLLEEFQAEIPLKIRNVFIDASGAQAKTDINPKASSIVIVHVYLEEI